MTKLAHNVIPVAAENQSDDGIPSAENRWEARRRSKFPAIIIKDTTGVGIRCTMTDMSSAGAMLEFGKSGSMSRVATSSIPETFKLHMPFDRTQVNCKVAWRDEFRIGVRYVSTMSALPPAPRRTVAKTPDKPGSKYGWPFNKAN